jgi:hypothetical protein
MKRDHIATASKAQHNRRAAYVLSLHICWMIGNVALPLRHRFAITAQSLCFAAQLLCERCTIPG